MESITIIGGEKRWYLSVTDELKLKLHHENGKHPERILNKLKKSKAVFIMLEAISHNASYRCYEFCKKHNIRIYILRGAKTQLKDMILKL